jgi:hypothetical protein
MAGTRVDERGQLVQIPPAYLACGCPWEPAQVTIGYEGHPAGGRARTYYCRACRVTTWSEQDAGKGPTALGR